MQAFNQDEVSACFEDFWTPYFLAERLTEKVHMMLHLEGLPRAPCMICYAPGGVGKTALAQEMLARSREWEKKLITISLQEGFQHLDLEASILTQLVLQPTNYEFTKNRTVQVREAMSQHDVGGLVIDDIHELLRLPPDKQRSSMLFLKGLACNGLSICAFGSRSFQKILSAEPHLSSSWIIDHLKPFEFNRELKGFLEEYSRNFPNLIWRCFDVESVSIIHKKTHGLIDNIVKVVQVLAAHARLVGGAEVVPCNVTRIDSMLDMFGVGLGGLYD
ncbi:TniB family NTP-binding protein [Pseudomonas monteilii]|uniref:TniB family NTP-binding protein n=1 Tax=Pseudomonas monteilii TaxID=76759 RepID=UPI001E32D118|nr:TniB family NTP-binding protein [Pseudomonas monteilii]MCE0876919.1 TniB family NTP-binding protein [Pseudomonas monteilii]MCE1015692.1 TniB family NTP-binding protein [Pseudomonas monteilii]MCE1044083.1 TniB family NTP-binding protein [Pseudomonas monteilii]WJN85590.1 TniB family NTP-binding protein [Pseudomonas monteilii]WJR47585.1 TniB family NTP-binding protein [Pseudomonas monteilii]